MKPTERVLEVDSTLAGENVRMGIDASAMQHVMSILTDLYSDPELAVIREYSTNALDAHRDAGNPLPIEVTLPTPLAPFFRVRDYGSGLDAEDIRSIYSQYGTSTKRASNDVVGMLGLGCKSALTYSDQFTLVGTKNGRTVQVSVHRDEDGGGSMTIVSDEATPNAASGVEVIVPAKRDNAFGKKARDFFKYWTPGTVLVNGEAPDNIRDAAGLTWLVQDRLAVVTRDDASRYDNPPRGWVIMGNVPYPIPEEGSYNRKPYSILAFVDIGEVNFTPSREALQMTRVTKATLERITEDVKRELTAAMQRTVTSAATPHEAILAAQKAEHTGVKLADLTYNGKPIPASLDRPLTVQGATPPPPYLKPFLVVNTGRYGRKSGEETRTLPAYAAGRAYFTNFEAQAYSPAKRAKLEAWVATPEGEAVFPDGVPHQLVCVDSLTADELHWTTGAVVQDWIPIQAMKVEKPATVGGYRSRPTGSYEQVNKSHIEAGDIDLTQALIWIRPSERHDPYASRWNTPPKQDYPVDATVLVMPANRLEKFKRDFPHAMYWPDYVKKEATDWLDQQDAALVFAAKYRLSQIGAPLANLDPDRIDDPDLAKWVRLQNTPGVSPVMDGLSKRRHHLDLTDTTYPDPLKAYPLVGSGGSKLAEHIYLYVNAAYAAHPAKESA